MDSRITSKQIHSNINAVEYLLVELEFNYVHLFVTTVYRSPNCTPKNNDALKNLITELCTQHNGNNLILGDFNYHIDWSQTA